MKALFQKPVIALAVIFALLFSITVHANDDFAFWPDADYDPSIPTIQTVLGYKTGDRITWHGDAVRYFEALAAAAPGRLTVKRYAESWEGRELIYVIIASKENLTNIDGIKAGMQKLVDPRITSKAQAQKIIENQPAITWLSYGVHGNEISSTDAAMLTAYHLLASRGDKRIEKIMQNSVVIIDPMQNPDGRDRFIHHFEMSEGLQPDPDRISAEHN
jgi:hypothetical protein